MNASREKEDVMAKQLNVGLIGYSFMGKAHSNAFRKVSMFFPEIGVEPVMKVICGRTKEAVRGAADEFGWEEHTTSWRRVIARDDIDVVDICTPGNQHAPMVMAALKAGKHVICEKPLTNTLKEAREVLKVAKKSRAKTMVAFNYRRVPAVALALALAMAPTPAPILAIAPALVLVSAMALTPALAMVWRWPWLRLWHWFRLWQ